VATPLITRAQLEERLSVATVRRIFDDNNDGTADSGPLTRLLTDASSKLRATLGPLYDLDKLDPATSDELVRISLDIAHAYAAQRHPEFVRVDGFKLMQQAEKELEKIRAGLANLGTKGTPEPAANQGGIVTEDPSLAEDESPHFALGGTGDF
jgi:phage gp36-like protein